MREDLYTILDNCLKMMDQGSDLESCLARYPEYATELRPLLMASMEASSLAEIDIPLEVTRRSRSRLLNIAAEMREQKSSKKAFFVLPMRRMGRLGFVALVTLLFLVGIGGTGLVQASSASLPGDRFYPVKLTWENIILKMAVSQSDREALADRFEQERVEEIEGLILSNRAEKVKFFGQVEGVFPGQIVVSGITVNVTPDTRIDGEIKIGAWVRIEGQTASEGAVDAEKIKVEDVSPENGEKQGQEKPPSSPNIEDADRGDNESGKNNSESTKTQDEDNQKTPGDNGNNDKETGKTNSEKTPSAPAQRSFEIEGIVTSYNGSLIVVNDRSIYIIPETELRGTPTQGSRVSIRGYVNENGALIAQRIEVKSNSNSGGGGGGSGGGGDSGGSGGDNDPTETPKPDDD